MFSAWDEILKGQPEWLEMPVEKALYEKAETAARDMDFRLEDVVLAFIIKLANDGITSTGITPDSVAAARLMREMEEEKRFREKPGGEEPRE